MGEWVADNWYVVLLLIIYLAERSPEVLKSLKEHAAEKQAARALTKIAGADTDAPETEDDKKRTSRVRKVACGALHLIPLISRIKRIGK